MIKKYANLGIMKNLNGYFLLCEALSSKGKKGMTYEESKNCTGMNDFELKIYLEGLLESKDITISKDSGRESYILDPKIREFMEYCRDKDVSLRIGYFGALKFLMDRESQSLSDNQLSLSFN